MIIGKFFLKKYLIFFLVLSIILVDQISKYLVSQSGFKIVCNMGVAFGWGGNAIFIVLVVLVFVFWELIYQEDKNLKIGIALIFAGGLANFLDRFVIGCVRDFIAIGKLPAFNLADSLITIGVILVIGNLIFGYKSKRE